MQQFVKTLNRFYLENRELWEVDTGWDGYEWIEPDDRDRSVIAFRRKDRKGRELVVVCNFCPVLRENYRLGLPKQGWYVPVLNTDDEAFGGYGFARRNRPHRKEAFARTGRADCSACRR